MTVLDQFSSGEHTNQWPNFPLTPALLFRTSLRETVLSY